MDPQVWRFRRWQKKDEDRRLEVYVAWRRDREGGFARDILGFGEEGRGTERARDRQPFNRWHLGTAAVTYAEAAQSYTTAYLP